MKVIQQNDIKDAITAVADYYQRTHSRFSTIKEIRPFLQWLDCEYNITPADNGDAWVFNNDDMYILFILKWK